MQVGTQVRLLPKMAFLEYQGWQTKTGDFGKILEKRRIGGAERAKMYFYLRFEWQITDNFRPVPRAFNRKGREGRKGKQRETGFKGSSKKKQDGTANERE
jgi:hypothetical protein